MNFSGSIQLAVTLGSITFGVCATVKAADSRFNNDSQ